MSNDGFLSRQKEVFDQEILSRLRLIVQHADARFDPYQGRDTGGQLQRLGSLVP